MGIDITQWRIEIAKYWKYVGRRRHSRGKSQGVKAASARSCNPLLALMLAFCLITAPSLLLVAGDVERNPGPPKLEKVESKLNIDDLGEVWEAVFTARTKSFKIGLKLRVPVDTLDSIATQFTDPGDRLLQTLKVWLKTATKPTWRAVVDALRNTTIGEMSLATDIEAKYCTAVEIGQAGGQTMSEVQPTATDIQLQTLQEELRQIKDQQLRDSHSQRRRETLQQESQRRMDTLQQELLDSLRQIQQQAVKDKQAGQRQLQELTLQLQSMKQQPQETIIELKRQLQQTQQQMEEKQHAIEAREGQLRELQLQLQEVKLAGAQEKSIPRPRSGRDKWGPEGAAATNQRTATQPQKALMKQKAIQEMKWQKESKAPENMYRGSAASDSNMAYFNGDGSTKVYSYDSDTHKWHRLPDSPHEYSTLVVVQHILTVVGGYLSGKVTNSLLSLMGEGGAMKWLPLYPAMPTARRYTAAMCSGHSLIVVGGMDDGNNSLATVEVLDTDTKQWSTSCSLPHPFSDATISICGEQLYLMANDYEEHSVLTCSVHELLQCQSQLLTGKLRTAPAKQTTKWQHIANTPHTHSSCATLCGQLIAVGGSDDDKSMAAIFGYNAITDSWEAMGDMPTARHGVLVAIVNGKLMAVGGRVGVRGRWLGWETATDVVEYCVEKNLFAC